jgi:PKD repeat protein
MFKVFTATIILCIVTIMIVKADSKEKFSVSPKSGSAPLIVTFTGEGSGHFEGVMALDFGDGEIDNSISTIRSFTRTHTYAVPGIYTAELKSGPYGGQRPTILTTVETVTISVRGGG